jgi:hypothetical protein
MRLFGLALIAALCGCDVAVGVGAAVAASRDDGGSGSGAPPPPPDPSYRVWVATLADDPAGDAQLTALVASGGSPDTAVWTHVGTGLATKLFDPALSFNAVLVQATSAQAWAIDAVEVLDAADAVVAAAGGTVWSSLVGTPANFTGAPDGLTAGTAATPSANAVIFTRYAAVIEKFRVYAASGAKASGDVEWVATWAQAGDQDAGGAAVDAAGLICATVSDGAGPRDIRLVRFTAAGALFDVTDIVTGVTTMTGSHAIAIDGAGSVYVTTTPADGNILTREYDATLAAQWTVGFDSGVGVDRVEANSIAVDGNGDVLVAGGQATLAAGIDHFLRKLNGTNGSTAWTQLAPVDAAGTGWSAVAVGAGNDIFSAGDLTSSASGSVEDFTRRTTTGNAVLWSEQVGDNVGPADRAHAVVVEPAGTILVGGSFGTAATGKDRMMLRYTVAGGLSLVVTDAVAAAGDDEILDVAVDADGTIYATGYETVAGQGKNLWLRKYDAAGNPVWTRTYHGGAGDDRGVSVMISGSSVIVVGVETLSGGATEIHVRRYAK